MNRNRWIILVAGGLVVATAAFLWFRPDKLLVDQSVDEELDDSVAAAIAGGSPGATDSVPEAELEAAGDGTATDDTTTTTTEPVLLGQGDFVSQGGHTVNGSAFVVEQPGGPLLVLPELDSENGPDLQLYLSPSAGGSVDGGVHLGPLKGNLGTQTYELPDGTDLASLPNVVIWCERFAVPFGTATLA